MATPILCHEKRIEEMKKIYHGYVSTMTFPIEEISNTYKLAFMVGSDMAPILPIVAGMVFSIVLFGWVMCCKKKEQM